MLTRKHIAVQLLAGFCANPDAFGRTSSAMIDTAIDMAEEFWQEWERRDRVDQTSPREESHDED